VVKYISRKTTSDPWPVADVEAYQQEIFDHYRSVGFPHFVLTPAEKQRQLTSLLNFDHSNTLRDNTVHQSMHALALSWSFHPHRWSIQCHEMRTPMQVFENDTLFMKAIKKRMQLGTCISDSGIRKACSIYSGTQAVSGFRPSAAASLFHHYCPEGGRVYDPSAGFGGRLLGSFACHVGTYIGVDPSTPTYTGLCQMRNELLTLLPRHVNVELYQKGSEHFRPEKGSIHCAMTSPPYWGLEKYTHEETQSWVRYPGKNEWLHGFMADTLRNCHYGIRNNGYLILNIAGTKEYPSLHTDVVTLAEGLGFRLIATHDLRLSKMVGTKSADASFKLEPCFVFTRR